MIWPIVCRGFSEPYGFWKMYAIRRRASSLRWRAARCSSAPPSAMVPVQLRCRPTTARATVVLPEPDSPTSARHSWDARLRLTEWRTSVCPYEAATFSRRSAGSSASSAGGISIGSPTRLCASERTSSARMQRTAWPGPTGSSGGMATSHWSMRRVQRGAKLQPGGRRPGDTACPGMPTSDRPPVSRGIAPTRRRV